MKCFSSDNAIYALIPPYYSYQNQTLSSEERHLYRGRSVDREIPLIIMLSRKYRHSGIFTHGGVEVSGEGGDGVSVGCSLGMSGTGSF